MHRLLGSQERLLSMLNAITDGVTAQDKTGQLIYANDAAAHINGYPDGESLMAAPLSEIAARYDLLDEAGNAFDFSQLPGRLALMGHPASERILRYRNRTTGEERWSVVKAQPVFDENGDVEFAVNIFRDVTAQKKHEILQQFMLKASETLAASLDYETTLASVARLATPQIADWCAVDLVDEQRVIHRVAVAHVDPEKVAWAYELQRQYPPTLEGESGFAKVINTGQSDYYPHIPSELLEAAAGQDAELLKIVRELDFRSSVIVPLTARGRTFGAITLVTTGDSGRHLTPEDVAMAEELGRTAALAVDNARLYNQTQSEREALQKYAVDLKRSNEELERFAYIASHDLQEPLRMVTIYLQLLEHRYKDLLDQDAKEFIGFAVDGAARMKKLIDDILMFSRVKTDDHNFVSFSAEAALKTALANLQDKIEENHARIRYDNLPTITGNENQFVQLFQNLVSNAIKFHGDQPPEIDISANRDRQGWLFTIKDNGIGIEEEYLKRIFVMFKRFHTKDEYPGTGIGLAVCRKVVEHHGGQIWAESKVGEGTTLYFTVPITGVKTKTAQDIQ